MKKTVQNPRRLALSLLIAGILFVCAGATVYVWKGSPQDITTTWQVTVVGSNGSQKILSYSDVKAMTPYTGHGGFFTTVGVINGPCEARGVPIEDLCSLVGGLEPSNLVKISAADGYSTMLDYEQVKGNFITYDPASMKEKPHGDLKPILMYQQDGAPLTADGGKPLRLAVVGSDGLLTEGLYWIKWINKIEVITPKPSVSSG